MQSTERQDTPVPLRDSQDDYDKIFARRFQELRQLAAVTQLMIAEQMQAAGYPNIHRSTVGKIENADRPVTVGEAVVLARIIGVDLEMLLSDPADGDDEISVALAKRESVARRMREAIAEGSRAADYLEHIQRRLPGLKEEMAAATQEIETLRAKKGSSR